MCYVDNYFDYRCLIKFIIDDIKMGGNKYFLSLLSLVIGMSTYDTILTRYEHDTFIIVFS